MPEADGIIVIWFKLLCLAGKNNNGGVFILGDKIPYTEEMLATIFRRKKTLVSLALGTFEKFGMIEIIDNVITIPKWEKHQNIDGLQRIKEQTKKRVSNYRARQKALCNVTDNVTVTSSNATEEDKDKEKNIDIEKESATDVAEEAVKVPYQEIMELFNTICVSFPKVTKMTEKRKKAVKARFNNGYTLEDFKRAFETAEQSDFLKGNNDRKWKADFDWLTNENNLAKTLEGKYNNKQGGIINNGELADKWNTFI